MMFHLEIECDNAAFEEDGRTEVARILVDTVSKVITKHDSDLYDIDGNNVGCFWFVT